MSPLCLLRVLRFAPAAIAAGLGVAPSARAQAPEVLHYTFDQGDASNSASGGIGAGHVGNRVDFGPGVCGGGAISTASSSACVIDSGWTVDFGTGSWSVGCWLDRTHTTLPDGTLQTLFGNDDGATGLWAHVGGNAGAQGILLRGGTTFDSVLIAHGGERRPLHVVWTYDAVSRLALGYLDGVLVQSVLQTGAFRVEGGTFRVMNAGTTATSMAPGYAMDDFRLYRRALTLAEVQAWHACGATSIGTAYCAPAPWNSVSRAAVLLARGSRSVAANDVQLVAGFLPSFTFGYFLTSRTADLVAQPGGSMGNLCLGGAIGRFVGPGQVLNSGGAGDFSLILDLASVPTPSGLVPVQAGETWRFQAWYRDSIQGSSTSNLTNGIAIQFVN